MRILKSPLTAAGRAGPGAWRPRSSPRCRAGAGASGSRRVAARSTPGASSPTASGPTTRRWRCPSRPRSVAGDRSTARPRCAGWPGARPASPSSGASRTSPTGWGGSTGLGVHRRGVLPQHGVRRGAGASAGRVGSTASRAGRGPVWAPSVDDLLDARHDRPAGAGRRGRAGASGLGGAGARPAVPDRDADGGPGRLPGARLARPAAGAWRSCCNCSPRAAAASGSAARLARLGAGEPGRPARRACS